MERIIEELRLKIANKALQLGHPMRYHIVTFGCQMNERDSEQLSTILEDAGFINSSEKDADLVIFNTCTVRENANNRLWGRLGYAHSEKKKNPAKKIALCGCMMQEKEVIEKIKSSYSFVDLVFGTHNLHEFPKLLIDSLDSDELLIDIWDKEGEIIEKDLPKSKFAFKSGVNIMFGCNNFCSYCIVPFVRGRERSRKSSDIINEIKELASNGVTEVMLLGQNVNSYGNTLDNELNFSGLLREVEKIDGIHRIRFMTSHPKDLSDELIDVMANSNKICHHLHLPLQSGSTRILKDMNRKYSKESYLDLCRKIKTSIHDIAITTDIIVGYPSEEEEDFLDTLDVVKQVEYASAFTFIYSPRSGTPAAKMINKSTDEQIKVRFQTLLDTIKEISERNSKKLEGSIQNVLIEQVNRQDDSLITGRMDNNMIVHLPGDAKEIGRYIDVNIIESKGFYYLGERI